MIESLFRTLLNAAPVAGLLLLLGEKKGQTNCWHLSPMLYARQAVLAFENGRGVPYRLRPLRVGWMPCDSLSVPLPPDLLGPRRAHKMSYDEGTGEKETEISYAQVKIAEAQKD